MCAVNESWSGHLSRNLRPSLWSQRYPYNVIAVVTRTFKRAHETPGSSPPDKHNTTKTEPREAFYVGSVHRSLMNAAKVPGGQNVRKLSLNSGLCVSRKKARNSLMNCLLIANLRLLSAKKSTQTMRPQRHSRHIPTRSCVRLEHKRHCG